MIIWCLEKNKEAIKFYQKTGGEIKEKRIDKAGNKLYNEIGIVYNLK